MFVYLYISFWQDTVHPRGDIGSFVCLFVCEQYYGKTPRRISTKLGGGVRYGPMIMPLNFGLGPKSNMAAMAAILKKYLNFFFFAFLHVLSDFQPPLPPQKKIVREKKFLQLFFQQHFDLFFLHFQQKHAKKI